MKSDLLNPYGHLSFMQGGGVVGDLIRNHDWSSTPLGEPASWPAALKTLVGIVLGSNQPMFVAWGGGRTLIYNDHYAEILAGKHPNAVGRDFLEVWSEIRADLAPIVAKAMVGEPVQSDDITLIMHRRGYAEETHFSFFYAPVRDEAGAVCGIFCACNEITRQIIAERAQREDEARLRAVLAAAPVGLVFADASGQITGGNARVEDILGHAVLPSAGIDSYDEWVSYHSDGRRVRGHEYPLAKALRGESAPELVTHYERGDGRRAWVRFAASAVRDDRGELLGGVVAAMDIDSEKRAQAALRRLNETLEQQVRQRSAELERIWRTSRDLLVLIDSKGIFRSVSPAWRIVLGHEPEEVIGRSFRDFVWPEDAELTQAGLDEAASERDLTNFENRYTHKDGTPRWISWLTSTEGDLVYAAGRDVTDQRAAAEALRRTEEQLRQSQKMEAVGQLTGGLAHDFNNLLTGIAGSLEILQTRMIQGRTDGVDRYLNAAQGAAKRAAALTHRLLAFSRRQTLDPKPVNVNRLIGDLEELIRRTVGPAVTVEVVGAGGLWPTLVDSHQLENALLNLCINARDAMPEGGRITIETANKWLDDRAAVERDLPPGQYISVCVSDTGSGMTSEVAARAFDPFFTTKPLGVGTGLGLSMIYGFVRQSGGHAHIYTELEQGTTVCLYLPRYTGSAEDADSLHVTLEAAPAQAGETVLVVDDEPTVRMLVSEVLVEAGYTILEAPDGASGLKVLQSSTHVDLLVTDVGLPGGMNGRQVADAARVLRPDLKVLFITGYAENAAVGNGHLEPGMAVLTKPFAMEALAAKVREIMDR